MMFDIKIDARDLSINGKWGRLIKKIEIDSKVKGTSIIQTLADQTATGMRMRVPRDTGKLAKSIEVKPRGKYGIEISVGGTASRPYVFYQEEGYTPHGVAITRPEVNAYIKRHGIKVKGKYLWVSKYTPFVKPTLEQTFSEGNVAAVINAKMQNFGGNV